MEYRPTSDQYWDESALEKDLKTAFDICNGCRLCHNLCPSFPVLFKAVESHDDNVEELTGAEMAEVSDLCYQCKLCYVKCPYIPPHRFDLDFPRLMLRSKAVRARKTGFSAADRFLGNPEKTGRLGLKLPRMANWANANPLSRRILERVAGIDRRRRLPRFSLTPFSAWAEKHLASSDRAQAEVAIFETCTVEYYESGIGQAAVGVLERNGVGVTVPQGQRCCGMPALDGGDIEGAMERARSNVALLAPLAREGKKILALQPTCAYMIKKEYPLLLDNDAAREVAKATLDVTEYLAARLKSGELDKQFQSSPGEVTYQLSCHTKAQGLNRAAVNLLGAIEGTKVRVVERCAGIDGTWGLKKEYFDESQKVSRRMTEAFHEAHDTQACSDCALAGLQIQVGAGHPPKHPVEILWEAYGKTPSGEGAGRD